MAETNNTFKLDHSVAEIYFDVPHDVFEGATLRTLMTAKQAIDYMRKRHGEYYEGRPDEELLLDFMIVNFAKFVLRENEEAFDTYVESKEYFPPDYNEK